MLRRQPRSTRTDTLFPYPTLFRSEAILGEDRVSGIRLKDGTIIDATLVVMAVGIRPNTELAQSCGLRCDRGVLVDDTMQTFDPRVYAVDRTSTRLNSSH